MVPSIPSTIDQNITALPDPCLYSYIANDFEQIQVTSDTVTALSFRIPRGSIDIYNIYNPPDSNMALQDLKSWLDEHPPLETTCLVWAGDFNKHDPLWTDTGHYERCRGSNTELLLQLIADHSMVLALPAGIPTYESDAHRTWSMLDLVFCTTTILSCIHSCDISHNDRLPMSDHLPVHTTINTSIIRAHRTSGQNF